mgnify:CR=1 FL=1
MIGSVWRGTDAGFIRSDPDPSLWGSGFGYYGGWDPDQANHSTDPKPTLEKDLLQTGTYNAGVDKSDPESVCRRGFLGAPDPDPGNSSERRE